MGHYAAIEIKGERPVICARCQRPKAACEGEAANHIFDGLRYAWTVADVADGNVVISWHFDQATAEREAAHRNRSQV